MQFSISEQNIFATAKVSAMHILDKDFLFALASRNDVAYVSLTGKDTVTVDLKMNGAGWPAIRNALSEDGWDSDLLPGAMEIFRRAVAQQITRIEFSDAHPKIEYADWFTPDTFIHLRPSSYASPLLSFAELAPEQKEKVASGAGKHTNAGPKWLTVPGSQEVFCTDDLQEFVLTEPEEIINDYDGFIETPDMTIAVKLYLEDNSADVALVLN